MRRATSSGFERRCTTLERSSLISDSDSDSESEEEQEEAAAT